MEPREPPPPRGYVGQALINIWTALGALVRGAVPRTADDSKRAVGAAAPVFVDKDGRPLPRTPASAEPTPPPPPAALAPAAPASPERHAHGALVCAAEGLERALLQPVAGAKAPALAAAHEEREAERVTDPFRRQITSG
ncbi:hypothetical protein MNEG_7098 [Monoraphidium neglectum]|jgi:hypothetical protein|uniref:Uncharacterized protein n=1 Tax=Monoraphidium neglectum TaxID=145388 RepID=A0A0D2L0A1_9CHLO|nr:hypothetical protein MNEG_7098 [Monoraphidium neglectum]KIZ00859.1 hypothetical protein MNEG_7098 [Monoraphidium neglectum]|eukprot:XP_013899878.1 hypothetical protein MNEG_7098 [Monoraphidium neglectum]